MSTLQHGWEDLARRHLVLREGITFSPPSADGCEALVGGVGGVGSRAVLLSGDEPYVASLFLVPILAGDVLSASSLPPQDVQRTVAALLDRGVLEEHRVAVASAPGVFNPATLGDPAVLSDVAGALAEGRAVIVRDALRPELAEEAYASLRASTAWEVESYFQPERPYFQFRRHGITWPLLMPRVLHDVGRSLGAPESKAFMQGLTGVDCAGPFVMCAASYRAGDYSMPHNDDGGLRALTYIWYVSKGWRPDWGGHLTWCPTGSMVTPEFNSLVLFSVSREALHFVTPVAPHAPEGRLSVSGWWQRAVASPDRRPVATVVGGVHVSPGVYGEPTRIVGGRAGVVAL